jgi:hypothetical protein
MEPSWILSHRRAGYGKEILSPLLFFFVAGGLSALLRQSVNQQVIRPVRICHRALGVSHLLFTDDTLLFFKAETGQAEAIRDLVDTYARATGQLINMGKCSIMFGRGCATHIQEGIRATLQLQSRVFEDKYLGLPTPEGRMNRGRLQNLQVRLTKRFMEWGDSFPSQAAKETLIKSIAQSIPTYIMSVFKLPMALCDDLNSMVRNYWWGSEKGKRKTHWKSWDALTHLNGVGV